jgi:hypothetical protein
MSIAQWFKFGTGVSKLHIIKTNELVHKISCNPLYDENHTTKLIVLASCAICFCVLSLSDIPSTKQNLRKCIFFKYALAACPKHMKMIKKSLLQTYKELSLHFPPFVCI